MSILRDADLLKIRRTRVIATLGPATAEPERIRALIGAGVNIFRLNMSHGEHDFHRQCFQHIRELSRQEGRIVGVMADLCGPKMRVGSFRDGSIMLQTDASVCVTTRKLVGEANLIPSQYPGLSDDVSVGGHILLNDGRQRLRVQRKEGTEIHCRVLQGGQLKDNQGINLPGVAVSVDALTERDRRDACFALELGVDFLALSFVRSARDVEQLRELVVAQGADAWIIAKIEKPEVLEHIDTVLPLVDAIMVARGDLGVELGPEQVPIAQIQLVRQARAACKPVIVATQILESMIHQPQPTRAEVSDIANAVAMGTDAVMLSGETAVGRYPLEAVQIMDRVARMTEAHIWHQNEFSFLDRGLDGERSGLTMPVWNAMADALAMLSRRLHVRSIVVLSHSGRSAATMSAARPAAPLLVVSDRLSVCRRMLLLWGGVPLHEDSAAQAEPAALSRRLAMTQGLAEVGDTIVLVKGFHTDPQRNIPSLTVITL